MLIWIAIVCFKKIISDLSIWHESQKAYKRERKRLLNMKKWPCQQLLFGSAIWFPISFHIIDMDARAVRFMNPNQLPHSLRKEKTMRDKQRKRESFLCLYRNRLFSTLDNKSLLWDKHVNTEKHTKQTSQILIISRYEKNVGLVRKHVNSLMIAGGINDI